MNGSFVLMRIDVWGFALAKQLLSLSWQFLILFIATRIAVTVLKRTSARIRHRLWTAAFLILPIAALLVVAAEKIGTPQMEIQIIPPYSANVPTETDTVPNQPRAEQTESAEKNPDSLYAFPWAVFLLLYGIGAAGFLCLIGLGRLRLEYLKNKGTIVTDRRILDAFTVICSRLGLDRSFTVIESSALSVPLTVGTFHPVIMMPSGFARNLSDGDLHAFIMHELAHVKRFDSLVLFYVSIVRALFFFNPAVWYAARQVSFIAESACDDIVLELENTPLNYAEMLIRLARNLPEHELTSELAAGFIISKHLFFKRVEQILADRKGRIMKLSKRALFGCLACGLITVLLIVAAPVGEVQVQELKKPAGDTVTTTTGTAVFRARVIDSKTKKPVAGVHIWHEKLVGRDNMSRDKEIVSDSNGYVELSGIEPGYAIFMLVSEGSVGRWWSRDSIQDNNTIIVTKQTKPGMNPMAFKVTENMKPVTILLESTMTITGTVFDPEGKPVSGATVAPAATGSGNSITGDTRFSVRTDQNGRYTIYLPPSGKREYNLVAHDGDYREYRTWANGVTKPMKIKSGERLGGLDIVLTRPATVRGIVVDTKGNPMADQQVMVTGIDGLSNRYYEPEGITDKDGRFEITHIRPGEIWIATPPMFIMDERTQKSFPKESMTKTTIVSGQTTENIRLVAYTMYELREYSKNK